MKFLAVAVGIFALTVPVTLARATTWKADPSHSEVDFTIEHLSVAKVHGRFGNVSAVINYDPANVGKSTILATVGVNTVDTGESGRDDEIKSSDFFDSDRFPMAKFTSTEVSKNGNNGLWIKGNLTLHGITKPVMLNVQGPVKPVQGPDGKPHSGFSATATINRTAFGIGDTFPSAVVGDQVELEIDLEVIEQ
jgi:polyisoprenoid-binding protein YceI